jgi:hypothetical protein
MPDGRQLPGNGHPMRLLINPGTDPENCIVGHWPYQDLFAGILASASVEISRHTERMAVVMHAPRPCEAHLYSFCLLTASAR